MGSGAPDLQLDPAIRNWVLLPIFVALGVKAEGSVMFWNKVYDGAMGWTSELAKFGAHAFGSYDLCDFIGYLIICEQII